MGRDWGHGRAMLCPAHGMRSAGSGAKISHAYAKPGTYAVTLTVTDNKGATASKTAQVTVSATSTNKPPSVALTGMMWQRAKPVSARSAVSSAVMLSNRSLLQPTRALCSIVLPPLPLSLPPSLP